jgi:micrococcal nuclease
MKRKYIIAILLLLLFAFPGPLRADTFTVKCVGISDGDTITVLRNNAQVKVRLEGIDCPELHQDFGRRAKKLTSALVFGKMVSVNVLSLDRYGRSVSRVSVGGKDVSLELVKAGLAWHYKKYSHDPLLAKAEHDARVKKIGLWSMPNPVTPWDYRATRKMK